MNQLDYIAIPDTSDSIYWALKISNSQERSQIFVPRDKELHQRLRVKAWEIIQTKQVRKRR